jgi:hypothetical protein
MWEFIKYILWVLLAVFLIWLFDFLRCKATWCTYKFWRFNTPKKCTSNDDCDNDYDCYAGRCVYTCDNTSDCPNVDYFSCTSGRCLLTCDTNADCLSGTECDTTNYVCTSKQPSEAEQWFISMNNRPNYKIRSPSGYRKAPTASVVEGYNFRY